MRMIDRQICAVSVEPVVRKLNILAVANVPSDPNSGAAGTVYHTNVALRELGHCVDEIWSDDLGPRRISHGNLHSLIEQPRAYWREVRRAAEKVDYDVILISQPQGHLVAKKLKQAGFRGIVINRSHGLELRADAVLPHWHKQLNIPQNRFPRNLLSRPLKHLLQRQWSEVMKYMDGVVVPCQMDREFLVDAFPRRTIPVRTVHHGVSNALLNSDAAPWSPERQKRILHVGQFAFFKGPHLVARIINEAFRRSAELTMTWVTSNEGCIEARNLIDGTHRDRVEWIPWTTQEDLLGIFDRHGLFLFPTLCEGAAKSALEAMARGLCVVASDDSGTRDYIADGLNGRRCPVGDVRAFTSAILEISQSDQANSISMAARDYACEKSWNACAKQLVQFFNEILVQRGE